QACQAVTWEMEKKPRVIYMTPQAKVFTQELAKELAEEENLIFLCGHYEGIDERVLDEVVTDYLSIGDYVLTGGELPAMVVMDAISRLVPGVLNNEISAETESFSDNLLDHPHYSRPPVWHEKAVPEVLMSGHHKNIETWRREQSILRTLKRRPELLEKAPLTKKEEDFIKKHLQSE
ncbi:MAG: tRNA (guanosine(37)-N1)-methyltransferase TrmD, partial [Acetivibrio ethanolgignens]